MGQAMPPGATKTVWDLLDQSWWAGIGLVIAVLGLAWAAHRLRAWYGEDTGPADGSQELLEHLRQLRGEGGLSEEEFRSIKRRLLAQTERPPRSGGGATAEPIPPRDGPSTSPGD